MVPCPVFFISPLWGIIPSWIYARHLVFIIRLLYCASGSTWFTVIWHWKINALQIGDINAVIENCYFEVTTAATNNATIWWPLPVSHRLYEVSLNVLPLRQAGPLELWKSFKVYKPRKCGWLHELLGTFLLLFTYENLRVHTLFLDPHPAQCWSQKDSS